MVTDEIHSAQILTAQRSGFLASKPYPFTHTLSPYTGCGFGKTACGSFCYAKHLPNWANYAGILEWGEATRAKLNAAKLLSDHLGRTPSEKRQKMRVFMSSTTDPYQPIEAKYEISRGCLKSFAQFRDLDLLVVQTRSPLAARDFDVMSELPYLWLSVTIETASQARLTKWGGGPTVDARFKLIERGSKLGLPCQIVVSPCLPYTPDFAARLADSGARRIVVDTFIAGDGTGGRRTAQTKFAKEADYDWRDQRPAYKLFDQLQKLNIDVTWSAAGFCGIPTRSPIQPQLL